MNRRALLAMALIAAVVAGPAASRARAEPVTVVASFSILADMVRQVGGDRVAVTTLVGADGDAHAYQPTPTDAKSLAAAKVLVLNGLGLEGWMTRLAQSSGFRGATVTASAGIAPRQMEEAEKGAVRRTITDPHAWQDLANGRLYALNIRDGLIKADPEGRATYEANARTFVAAIDALEPEVRKAIATIPAARRRIITSHDAFGYFGSAYGMVFLAPEGLSTESEASAKDVARIIRQIKADKVPAVFVETITDTRLLEQISRESGARIGGALYSDALSPPDGPAPTYLDMFRHNVRTLAAALSS